MLTFTLTHTECAAFPSHDPVKKRLSDPVISEQLLSERSGLKCKPVSAGSVELTPAGNATQVPKPYEVSP